jgi:hypothetical protein
MSSRIRMVKFYQAVLLEGNGGSLSSFTPDDLVSDAALQKGLRAEVVEHGVMLHSKIASTLVPWNNVAYIQNQPVPAEVKPAKSK